jgi:hypothetical protein
VVVHNRHAVPIGKPYGIRPWCGKRRDTDYLERAQTGAALSVVQVVLEGVVTGSGKLIEGNSTVRLCAAAGTAKARNKAGTRAVARVVRVMAISFLN